MHSLRQIVTGKGLSRREKQVWHIGFPAALALGVVCVPPMINVAQSEQQPLVCVAGHPGYEGPGAAQRIIEDAANQAGVENIDNPEAAANAVQAQAGGLVISPDQAVNVCFTGGYVQINTIYPLGTGETPAPTPAN